MGPTSFMSSSIHPGRVAATLRPNITDVLAEPAWGMQRFILRELIGGPRSIGQLVSRIYNHGEDEPENPEKCIHVTVCKLNKKLCPGWRIKSVPNPYATNARGRQQRYELRREQPANEAKP